MPAVLAAISPSRRAANVAIETWSSWLAEVGRLSTEAGCARLLFSLASAAAVTCAIMKPEFSPPFSTRNGGSFDKLESINSAMRRSAERADLGDRQGEIVGGKGHRLGVEIAAGIDRVLLGKHQRVVGDGVGFGNQDVGGVADLRRDRRPSPVAGSGANTGLAPSRSGRASEPISLALAQQMAVGGGRGDLAGVPAHGVQPGVERHAAAQRGLDR